MLDAMQGRILLFAWVTTALFSALLACDGGQPERPPSLILVSLDTLRFDHLGHAGYVFDTSPNLDALAEQAVVFEHTVAQASSTTPSHHSLFQSRPASAYRSDHPSLAEVLLENGYRC